MSELHYCPHCSKKVAIKAIDTFEWREIVLDTTHNRFVSLYYEGTCGHMLYTAEVNESGCFYLYSTLHRAFDIHMR